MREIKHYKEHLKGKVLFCNCDDPRVSNFFSLHNPTEDLLENIFNIFCIGK